MSFSDYMDDQTLPKEILQHRAWSVPWYREGFEHGMNAAVTMMGEALDMKPETIQAIKDEFLKNTDHLMNRALEGAYDNEQGRSQC